MAQPVASERTKIITFAGLGFLLQAGLVLGITTGDSLFLSRVGPPGLPAVYILQTFVMLLHTAVFVAQVRRVGIDGVFSGSLALLAVGGVAVWLVFALFDETPPGAVYYAIKLYAGMWYFGLYTLFWTFLDSYFDLIDAKRFYAVFAAGSAAGAMAGGGLVSWLADAVSPGAFFLGWAALAVATWPVLRWIRRRWSRIDVNEDEADPGESVFRDAIAGVASLGRSRYALALTAGFFFIAATATICDFEYMRVFSIGRDEADLAVLFGRVTLVANLANMLITLFLFNPLVTRFGVRNLALLQPAVFALVFLWFAAAPGMGAAVAGFLAYHALMMAIDINNGNLLVFGLPAGRRKELRTFIEGICLPAAAAGAGLFLLVVAPRLGIAKVALIGVASAVLTFGFNVVVRRDYVGAIAANLRAGWLDLSSLPPRSFGRVANADLATPASISEALSAAGGETRAARLTTIAAKAGVDAIEPLLQMAGDYSATERQLVERSIVAMGAAAVPSLVDAAQSPRYPLRARSIALRALGKLDIDRLRALASPLMRRTAERAFDFLGRYAAFADIGSDDAATTVLRRINSDYPALTREVVLEALTISGRLPPYEAIAVALNGGASRERGFAVETVEQGAGQTLRRLLAPWIAEWPEDRRLAYARAEGLLPAIDEQEALSRAAASAFPLEAAAAGQALWERGARQQLVDKLRALPHPILEETARVLLARGLGEDAGLTPIECVAAAMRVPELSAFRFVHLEWLAPHLPTARVPAGEALIEPGAPLDRAWVVLEGGIAIEGDGARQVVGCGRIAGLRALTGDRRPVGRVVAVENLHVLTIPAHAVLACGEVFPELGIELLRMRLAGE